MVTEALEADRVDARWVGEAKRPVFVKRRYLVEGQKVFKVNHGAPQPPASSTQDALEEMIASVLDDHDALVVSDFGYGLFGPRLSSAVSELSKARGRPYYADVSQNGHANLLKFDAPRFASPTETELRFALADAESGLSNLAANYYQKSRAEGLILTLAKRGAIYFAPPVAGEPRLRTEYLPALASTSVDNVGAGDAFLAALVLSDLAEASPPLSLYVASLLSAHKIQHVGNDPVDADELLAALGDRPELDD
jgi:D-beta-D-heptose 7-phosphate kinase/D-beta-D-heptose 1-phosphate adenosyltransferase